MQIGIFVSCYIGAVVSSANIYFGADINVISAGCISSCMNKGNLIVSNGGQLYNTNNSNYLKIGPNGYANTISVYQGGQIEIMSSGTAENITINKGAVVYTNVSGYCNSVTVLSGGTLIISSNASAANVTSNKGAVIIVSSGGHIN